MKPKKHILAIRLSAMGDVAISVPVLRAFTSQNPNVKVTVLTRAFFTPMFNIPNVAVFIADLNGEHKGVFGLFKLYKSLKKIGITEIADLHNVLRTKILKAFFIGFNFKQINKGRTEKKALVSGKVFKPLKSSHERYADVFRALGYKVDLNLFNFPIPELWPASFPKQSLTHKTFIGIAPYAQYDTKMYPLSKMEIVIEQLSKNYNVLLFGGGKKEKEVLGGIAYKYTNVFNCAGKFNFKDELAIISNLDLMLSMDSGNGHLAAMYGVKVITIWGNTHPYAGFVPYSQPEDYQITPNRDSFPLLPTSIYGNKFIENYKTVAGTISTTTVIHKIASVLNTK